MSTLLVDQLDLGITRITLNRPETLNAMNSTLIADLHDALNRIASDPSCRVVVLTGAGRGFCAGLELGGYGGAPGATGVGQVEDALPRRPTSQAWCHDSVRCPNQ